MLSPKRSSNSESLNCYFLIVYIQSKILSFTYRLQLLLLKGELFRLCLSGLYISDHCFSLFEFTFSFLLGGFYRLLYSLISSHVSYSLTRIVLSFRLC